MTSLFNLGARLNTLVPLSVLVLLKNVFSAADQILLNSAEFSGFNNSLNAVSKGSIFSTSPMTGNAQQLK